MIKNVIESEIETHTHTLFDDNLIFYIKICKKNMMKNCNCNNLETIQ